MRVLRGASGLLSQQLIGVIQFEYNKPWLLTNSTLAEAYGLLESFDYSVFLLRARGLFVLDYQRYGEYFGYSNFVAVAPDRLPALKPFIEGRFVAALAMSLASAGRQQRRTLSDQPTTWILSTSTEHPGGGRQSIAESW